jgi:pimeloyl-ACP methyl ester carboxylesterase
VIATTRDGRTLNFEQHGTGRPTVVFEAGMGASRSWWGAVVPAVAARTSVVTYDRSGLGRSLADAEPRSLDRLARDLLDLLDALDGGPFVLVGHSWGGPIIRLAAAIDPDRVAGLVLVDPTDEGCELFFGRGADLQTKAFVATLPVMAKVGALGFASRSAARALPAAAAAAIRAEEGSAAHAQAYRAELAPSLEELLVLRDAPPPVPTVPLTVISGTKSSRLGRTRRTALLDAHRSRAESAPQGRHVRADGSAHLVILTEPALVADEVLRVVDAVRSGAPS